MADEKASTSGSSTPSTSSTPSSSSDSGSGDKASGNYARGENQKPVSNSYRDNWNLIFSGKKTAKKTSPKKAGAKSAKGKKKR